MVTLSQNYMLQDHLTVSSHAVTNKSTRQQVCWWGRACQLRGKDDLNRTVLRYDYDTSTQRRYLESWHEPVHGATSPWHTPWTCQSRLLRRPFNQLTRNFNCYWIRKYNRLIECPSRFLQSLMFKSSEDVVDLILVCPAEQWASRVECLSRHTILLWDSLTSLTPMMFSCIAGYMTIICSTFVIGFTIIQIQTGICRARLTNCPGALTKCQNAMWNMWAFRSFF